MLRPALFAASAVLTLALATPAAAQITAGSDPILFWNDVATVTMGMPRSSDFSTRRS